MLKKFLLRYSYYGFTAIRIHALGDSSATREQLRQSQVAAPTTRSDVIARRIRL